MSYIHLTVNERNKIEVLLKENYSVANIAKILGYHRSTIYREINRLNTKYSVNSADKISKENSKMKGRKTKFSSCLKELIEVNIAIYISKKINFYVIIIQKFYKFSN